MGDPKGQAHTKRQQEQLAAIFHATPDIVWVADLDGHIRYLNEAARKTLGAADGADISKCELSAAYPEWANDLIQNRAIPTAVEKGTWRGEAAVLDKDGNEIAVSQVIMAHKDAAGRVKYLSGIAREITKMKVATRALRKGRDELEDQAEKNAEELSRTVQALQEEVAEHLRAKEDLARAKRRLAEAQRIAHLGNWDWDIVNNELWWSDEVYRIFAAEPQQFPATYEAFLAYVHPDDRDSVNEAVDRALHEQQPYDIVHRIVRQDSAERTVHERAEITLDDQHNAVRMMGTVQDVTDLKRQEQMLARQAEALQDQAQLLDLARDTIIVHDMEGKIIFWNHGAELMYGWKKDEALGEVCHQLLQTQFTEPLIQITTKLLRQGQWNGELIHTTRHGQTIVVASRWALRKEQDGTPNAILEIDTDITEQKQAEQASLRARRYAEAIINTVRESLVILDPELNVISANRAFYDTFKTDPASVRGRRIYELNNRQWDIPGLRDLLEGILPQNTKFENFEVQREFEGMGRRTLVLNARRIYEEKRKTQMILLAIQDMTVFKQQQKKIEEDQKQLASLTEELLMSEERQRQQTAAALHDTVGQVLAFSKKELRAMQKKASGQLVKTLEQVTGQIEEAIQQTRTLTFQLSPPTLHTFGLEAAIEELAEEFSKKQEFTCQLRTAGQAISLSEQLTLLLYRATRELLTNVAKHAQATQVDISLERIDKQIRLTVEDDGDGFDVSTLNYDCNADTRKFGILSIQQRLTHLGGRFDIDSVKGKGTKVTLIAPADPGHDQDRSSES